MDTEGVQLVESEELKAATVRTCLAGMLDGAYQYRGGSWALADIDEGDRARQRLCPGIVSTNRRQHSEDQAR